MEREKTPVVFPELYFIVEEKILTLFDMVVNVQRGYLRQL